MVDSRPKRKKYDKGHIPTAISIPDSQFDKLKDQLPDNKGKTLVFYCGGLKCPLSHKSAKKAIDLGYTNVKVFSAGYPAWKEVAGTPTAKAAPTQIKAGKEEGSINVETFKKILKEDPESILLIDVRDPDEYAEAHIPGSINIPVAVFASRSEVLDKKKKIVVYCNSGGRSYNAYRKLMKLGYKNINQTIFADWKEAGLPVAAN